ncbi:U3 small nucleolar RNA-associated-like protein [Wolffia australiana]
MADVVQFRLERMVDELEDLVSRGLFSRSEIAEIVNRRRDFEYRLKRPRPLKQDFLHYIDYETKIDALRNIRKGKIIGELRRQQEKSGGDGERAGGKLWKKSVSDFSGVARILDIYRLAVVRHKGDLDLWFRYLEFCRDRKHGRMKQLLAQAIRFHPKVPGLWIYAAAWEFDQQLNVSAARALMQRGLRECPNSEELWIEYLRMELTYLNKLKARKIALGEEVGPPAKVLEADEQRSWKEENEDLFLSLNEEQDAQGTDSKVEQSEDFFWRHGSSILRTIYQGAVEAMPSSISFRKRFLKILDDVDLVHSELLKHEVMEDIKKQFSGEEDYWDWIARLQIHDPKKIQSLPKTDALSLLTKALQVYDEALCLVPSAKMYSLFAKFFDELLSSLSTLGISIDEFDSNIVKIFKKAESSGFMSDDLAHQYVSIFLHLGNWDEARRLAEKLCAGTNSKGPKLWNLRISMEMKYRLNGSAVIGTADLDSIFSLFKLAADRVPVSESVALWQEAISFFSDRKEYFEKLTEFFVIQLPKSSYADPFFSIFCAIINWIFQRRGIHSARSFYQRILSLPRPSLSIFLYCIQLESNLASSGDKCALPKARKNFESAIAIYGENPKLWKEYHCFETKVGTSESASAVYWRSKKALNGNDFLSDDF